MVRNGDSLVSRFICFEDDVTPGLVHVAVAPVAAECIGKSSSGQVARNLHATDRVSSRTRWSRTRSGLARSKKYAPVASITFRRSSSHVLPSVKMFSVRHSAQNPPSASWTTSKTNSAIGPSYGIWSVLQSVAAGHPRIRVAAAPRSRKAVAVFQRRLPHGPVVEGIVATCRRRSGRY